MTKVTFRQACFVNHTLLSHLPFHQACFVILSFVVCTMKCFRFLAVLLLPVACVIAQDNHHDHGEEIANLFEWGGIYHTPKDGVSALVLAKVNGEYATVTMDIAVLAVPDDSEASLHNAEGEGNHALEQNCTVIQNGGTMPVLEDACFTLVFDQTLYQSTYKIDTGNNEFVALFAQHFLTEFGEEADSLFDYHGDLILPDHTIPEYGSREKPWGEAIGASICVLMATFSGIVVLALPVAKFRDANEDMFNSCIYAFSSGAILATAFFFMLFEAVHLIGTGYEEEVDAVWRYGIMVLSGIIFPFVLEMIALAFMGGEAEAHPHPGGLEMVAMGAKSANSSKPTSAGSTKTAKPVARILAGILIGDFCHNFVDGVLIGSAFLGCGNAAGWAVATGAISHEIAQEIGDFCLLTGAGNMAVIPALFCNFLSGCSVVIGCAIVLSQDVEDFELGLILAFGSGSYIAIGATESLPRVVASAKSTVHRVAALLSFMLGAVVIGVVLMDHEHCEPGGGDHGH